MQPSGVLVASLKTIHCTANHGGRFVLAGRPCDRLVSLLAGRSLIKPWCGSIRKIYIILT